MTFEEVNSKVIRAQVSPQTPILGKRGAMLGYDGKVSFRPVSAGVSGTVMGRVTGEGTTLMGAEGQGNVLYGYRGLHVAIVNLTDDSLTVEADRLLAYDASLQVSTEMIAQGGIKAAVRGAMTGQGLFTTKIHGHGAVALLSHGGAFPLHPSGDTVGVDPQAYVGHVGNLNVDLKAKVGWRDAVGKGSGEAFQLHVSGNGTVYVQASEQKF